MNELFELIFELKKSLNEENVIKDLKKSYKELQLDIELLEKIKDYKQNKNYSLEKEINENINYRNVKHQEARLSYLILEINNKLKEIVKEEKYENN